MHTVCFYAIPFVKEEVTLALEAGVDCLIVPDEHVVSASSLARCHVVSASSIVSISLASRDDEKEALNAMKKNMFVMLTKGWEIIPVENLLAHDQNTSKTKKAATGGTLALEVTTAEEAKLAIGILETGVNTLVVLPKFLHSVRDIVASIKEDAGHLDLEAATITEITPVHMGHRVCVDTLSIFTKGQGMLLGNSAAFSFLVNAETEHNEYVASRPFRINAGAVHAYAIMPRDTTCYLEELGAGSEILIADHTGKTSTAIVGRVKVERRPMLLIRAKTERSEGAVFLQNAETIRLVKPDGETVSVVDLQLGDTVLCRTDVAGRHFGIRITEDIKES